MVKKNVSPAQKIGRNGNWALFAKLYEDGMPQAEIARQCGVSRQAVYIGLSSMYEPAAKPKKGKKKSNAKKKSKK